jgi:hypothetical protein
MGYLYALEEIEAIKKAKKNRRKKNGKQTRKNSV